MSGRLIGVQLREKLKSGSYLGIYDRNEILAHEAVHAARSAFQERENEEFFAYLTSGAKWRRAIGPIVRRPWEVWPLLITSALGGFFPAAFGAASIWVGCGFVRLLRQHWVLKRASSHLLNCLRDEKKVRAVLVRLTDSEIRMFSKWADLKQYALKEESLRWRVIRLAYLN
jgi:hypothetical protein